MPKRWHIKPGRSLRENARSIVPGMVDEFLSQKGRVISHPRLKQELHRMRLAGKTLRYAMETFEPGFDAQFSECLERVKQLLVIMGSIHDCDVNIPRLQGFLKEVRHYNALRRNLGGRLQTSALMKLIRSESARRKELFVQMTVTLEQWERDNFRGSLFKSMDVPDMVMN